MTEKTLQRKVLKKLREEFGGLWINTSPGPYTKTGVADIIGCLNGLFFAFELKAPGRYKHACEGLTDAQLKFLERVVDAGGRICAADSWEEVKAQVEMRLMGLNGSPSSVKHAV